MDFRNCYSNYFNSNNSNINSIWRFLYTIHQVWNRNNLFWKDLILLSNCIFSRDITELLNRNSTKSCDLPPFYWSLESSLARMIRISFRIRALLTDPVVTLLAPPSSPDRMRNLIDSELSESESDKFISAAVYEIWTFRKVSPWKHPA